MKKRLLSGLMVVTLISSFIAGCVPTEVSTPLPEKRTITIVDSTGRKVEVPCPAERIVSLQAGASELICILGAADRIVGRNRASNFPPCVEEKLVVAQTTQNINMELLLEQKPDLVIATSYIPTEMQEKIEAAGIPVVIVATTLEVDPLINTIRLLGQIQDKSEEAEEIIGFVEHYVNLVRERTGRLKPEEKPLVYHELTGVYHTCATGTYVDTDIVLAGGINIAASEPVKYPLVSVEWVLERNPDIILKVAGAKEIATEEVLKEVRDEIMTRSGLRDTKAVIDGRVYVHAYALQRGPQLAVGLLYWAKWFHPELFKDINPSAVHKELLNKFYKLEPEGIFVYPE